MTEVSWIWRTKIILKKQTIDSVLRKVMMLEPFYKAEARNIKQDWNWTLFSSYIGIVIIFQKAIFMVFGDNSMSTLRQLLALVGD